MRKVLLCAGSFMVVVACAMLTFSGPTSVAADQKAPVVNHWRHHDGHWNYWHDGDRRWYYTDGSHWFYNDSNAWTVYAFDKQFGKVGFEKGEYKVPGKSLAQGPTHQPTQAVPHLPSQPDPLKWGLERLSKEPFNLIKAVPDVEKGQVRFVLEFTRAPTLTEIYEWERAGGPVIFRFVDEDGIVLRSITPKLDGELVRKSGARIRLLLPLPDDKVLELTRSVVAN